MVSSMSMFCLIGFILLSCSAFPINQLGTALASKPLNRRTVVIPRDKWSKVLHAPRQEQASGETRLYGADAGGSGPTSIATKKPMSWRRKLVISIAEKLTTLFPVWTLLFATLGVLKPSWFSFFTTDYFTASLAVLMLSMGVTLTPEDFVRVSQEPTAVLLGSMLCYILCPVLGIVLGKLFNIPVEQIAGMVLIGSLNGGQTSNLCTFIANGDVPLSVLMTTVTTVASIFMTPLICKVILGKVVPIDAMGIAISCLQVILAPIAIGMAMNKYAKKAVHKILPLTPVVGMIATCLLVGSAVSQCAGPIAAAGMNLQIPIMLFHLLSGLGGYYIPKLLGFNQTQCRTMAIETSMKSSAFGFLLAKQHFKTYGARIPPAVSVVWVALVGATLAVFWKFIPITDGSEIDVSINAAAI